MKDSVTPSHTENMADWTERIFEFIKKWKYFIQAFWLLSAIGCCFFALDLPNQTVFQFLPPSGSESDIAYNEMGKYFPDFLFIDVEVILVQTKWNINKDKTNGILSNPNTSKIVISANLSFLSDRQFLLVQNCCNLMQYCNTISSGEFYF